MSPATEKGWVGLFTASLALATALQRAVPCPASYSDSVLCHCPFIQIYRVYASQLAERPSRLRPANFSPAGKKAHGIAGIPCFSRSQFSALLDVRYLATSLCDKFLVGLLGKDIATLPVSPWNDLQRQLRQARFYFEFHFKAPLKNLGKGV